MTEAEMLQRLRARYTEKAGNGDAWAFVTHVRNAAGFDANRTIDALAMSLWPSRGLELLGFEVKCSRADWIRELQRPEKAEAFARLVDRWFLVVADPKIVHDGELPPTWGLLVAHGKGLRCVKDAPRLRPAEGKRGGEPLAPGFGRSFLAALLRASAKGSLDAAQLAEARETAREVAKRQYESQIERLEMDLKALSERVRTFEQATGLQLGRPGLYAQTDPAELGRAVRTVLRGEHDASRLEKRLGELIAIAERIAADARHTIENGTTSL